LCFNNIFFAIDILEKPNPLNAVETHIKTICKSPQKNNAGYLNGIYPRDNKCRSFRIVTSHENKLISVSERIKSEMERFIAEQTRLRINRSKPDTEYWFLYRSEGFSIFLQRLSKHTPFDKTLHKGELQPQLSYMMAWLSNPEKSDVVADPFCGYGSIMEQRLRFPLSKFYSFDLKDDVLEIARSKIKGDLHKLCCVKKLDVNNIFSFLQEGSVDKIITDPPWGIYERLNITIQEFYTRIIEIFHRLLKNDGVVILLTACEEEVTASLSSADRFAILDTLHILVSGKKAGLFRLRKIEQLGNSSVSLWLL
jgi:tRNA G10  N-methylase Trm11